jgi:hypothetical protein
MLIKSNNEFIRNLHITTPLDDDAEVLKTDMSYFDKEGYEVNKLELKYYRQNHVPLGNHLLHTCCQIDWIVSDLEPKHGPFFDHCMLVMRWDYQGAAREQIARYVKDRPVLNKLLKVKPKWGIDSSLDYMYKDGEIMEMFHIEADRNDVDAINELKAEVEKLLLNTDWDDAAQAIRKREDEWRHLNADDQGDWKCRYFGLERSYDNIKVL